MQLELPSEGGMLSGVSTEEDTEVPPLLSAECHQTEQVPGSSPGWIPEERRGKPAWANTWQALQVVPRSRKFTQVLPWCEAEPTAQRPEGLSPPSMSRCRQP